MRMLRAAIMGMVFLAGVSGIPSEGQMGQPFPEQPPAPGRPGVEVPPMGPSVSPQIQARQAQSQNSERQKRLIADTNKLLVLATELKQDVDKTNKDVLSVDVIKKADEIEKLAHSVKERMKG
ncbi:hypothetical protein P8936_07335 [Edaphobacter paludis]|uniref:Uncharacterized protein n=1 Tax=Edaphobacter paludis TaxID=3035702 RepID=A0AAU7D144_9BACT